MNWALEEIAPGVQRAPMTRVTDGYVLPSPPKRRTCQRCGESLRTARQTKWCSEHCRKRAAEEANRGSCTDCGATLSPGSGWRGTERCADCHKAWLALGKQARIEDVAVMYREGMPVKEIAKALGYGPNSQAWEVTEARRQGLIGYRYAAYEARHEPT